MITRIARRCEPFRWRDRCNRLEALEIRASLMAEDGTVLTKGKLRQVAYPNLKSIMRSRTSPKTNTLYCQ
ncbi:hypothetical protein DPMN_134137 [Dreissena polymorpha]|uniref:Uncharacterized protein n=1 Tax=Dreissena polymorpha TaxID=45954 RepID=A0A9D4FZB8_DREPO|nr:hypothetical protein DPMN_134137 [Dreissena polymorpha]